MILSPNIPFDRSRTEAFVYPHVRAWQRDLHEIHLLPIIGIVGTRGKSTVLRLTESVLKQLHFRTATWTDLGVSINGRNQRGEISGWGRAMQRLAEGTLDFALQELDWATLYITGLPHASYPVTVYTGLDENGSQGEYGNKGTRYELAQKGLLNSVRATHHAGMIIANADDYNLIDSLGDDADATVLLVAQSPNSPMFRKHMEQHGLGAWVDNGNIWIGSKNNPVRFGNVREFPITFDGQAEFNIKNLLLALTLLHGIGIDLSVIRNEFLKFRAAWDILPASMNMYQYNDARAIIDQLAPAWILKDVLRVVNPGTERRQITVVGDLNWIEADEVEAVGRLLGRYRGAIVMHGEPDSERIAKFKRGLRDNQFAPLLVVLPTERRAINRAFKALRPNDVLLILTTHDSGPAHRAVRRHLANMAEHDED